MLVTKKEVQNVSIEIPADINKGEIYIATCKISKKSYIGQAKCYINNEGKFKIWGIKKRWKSHIYEARSELDHSKILNSAIRKYGEDNFIINTLIKCDLDKMDYWETEYIKAFNTIIPNGYNIMKGGAQRSVSEEAKQRLKEIRTGRKHSDLTKLYMTVSHLERPKKNNLPDYIYKNDTGYKIKYPIIENNKIIFIMKQKRDLNSAIKLIETLEVQHNSTEKIKQIKENRALMNKKKKDKMIDIPEFIVPIYNGIYKVGYRVEGLKFCDGSLAQTIDFNAANTNTRNLKNAKNYLKSLQIQNSDLAFKIPELPKGFNYFEMPNKKKTKKLKGFQICTGYKIKNKKKITIYKSFIDTHLTMEEKYNLAKKLYDSLQIHK